MVIHRICLVLSLFSIIPIFKSFFLASGMYWTHQALGSGLDGRITHRVGTFYLHPRLISVKIMQPVAHTLAAISIGLLYVNAWKDLFQNLQNLGIQQIGRMGVFEELHWVATMDQMGFSRTRGWNCLTHLLLGMIGTWWVSRNVKNGVWKTAPAQHMQI